jgi:hypothetical protein
MGYKNENPLSYLFVRDAISTSALSFRGAKSEDESSLVLQSFIQSEDRPFPLFLHVPLSELQGLTLDQIEPHSFTLSHRDFPNERGPKILMYSSAGPGEQEETWFGEFKDSKDGRSYDFVMITDPEPITVAVVGAAICLLKIGLERLVARCSKECRDACKGRVRKCEGHSTFGISVDDGLSIGCNYKCKAECLD